MPCTGINTNILCGMGIKMTPLSLTALRSQLLKIVDRVIETGMPVEIERKGHKLKIVLAEKKSKFDYLKV